MAEARTTPAKHIFLDVVGFTRKRSVEAQSEIVEILNRIVRDCLKKHAVPNRKRILLPTGDGICIALLNIENPYDIHVQLALSILKALQQHNTCTEIEDSRKFEVRIGINANTDNLVTDINGRRNVAGAGINVAQRVMDNADGGQVLVSQTVYEHLRHREKYMYVFEEFTATTKHGERVNVYQLLDHVAQDNGLNVKLPSAFRFEEKDSRLSRLVAYYLAHAMANRQDLLTRKAPDGVWSGVILLYFLAIDSVELYEKQEFEEVVLQTYEADNDTPFSKQYDYYSDLEVWVRSLLSKLLIQEHLSQYNTCFTASAFTRRDYRFVSPRGQEKLREEWPQIWEEFSFNKYVTD